MHSTAPSISVLIVSDYAAGGPENWKLIRRALTALSRQDLAEPVEYILCESERFRQDVPNDLTAILPTLRVVFVTEFDSYAVKNQAVLAASSEFVALLDADCIPDPDWLRLLLETLRQNPSAAAVSGRTDYPGNSLATRLCALLGRSYIDPGHAGLTRFIAINNCAFRTSAYLANPLPTGLGTFSSRIQSEALRGNAWTLRFDPRIRVVHDFEGWSMEADFRRNCGHGTIKTRLRDETLPYSWLARLGRLSIPPILAGKIVDSWRDCFRCGPRYGLRWYHLPFALLFSVGLHLLEIPGMFQAYRAGGLKASSFR